jgi:hypothetical protein
MELPFETDIVVCPQCLSEYQLHVTHCLDCGTPTQSAWNFPDRGEKKGQPLLTLPPEGRGYSIDSSTSLELILGLGAFLEERGVACSLEEVEKREQDTVYRLWVAKEDSEQPFSDLRREYITQQISDEYQLVDLPPTDQCPACHAEVSPEAPECPSCGLALSTAGAAEPEDPGRLPTSGDVI